MPRGLIRVFALLCMLSGWSAAQAYSFEEDAPPDSSLAPLDSAAVERTWNAVLSGARQHSPGLVRPYVAERYRNTRLVTSLVALGSVQRFRVLRMDVYPAFARLNLEITENFRRSYHSFYFVRESGKVVLTYRWHAYSQHWVERRSPHFTFVYNPYKDSIGRGVAVPTNMAASLLERHRAAMANLLNPASAERIYIYLVNTKAEMMSLFGSTADEAFIEPETGAIVSEFPHGVFQLVTTRLLFQVSGDSLGKLNSTGNDRLCRLFINGVATFGDGNGGYVRGKSAVFMVRTLISQGRYIPLRDALSSPDNPLVVAEAGAFVRFLVSEFGASKFRSAARSIHRDADFIPVLERVYGMRLPALERDFRVWVVRQNEEVLEPSELVEFRILTHLWDVQRVGGTRVYVDRGMSFPPISAIGRVMTLFQNRVATQPATIPYIYLAASESQLAEFHIQGSAYVSEHVMIAASTEALKRALRSRRERR